MNNSTPGQSNGYHLNKTDASPSITTTRPNFKISEQKVQLDVDLLKNGVTGITELVIFPQDNRMREIVLDCQDTINIIDVSIIAFSSASNQPLNYQDIQFEHYNATGVLENTVTTTISSSAAAAAAAANTGNEELDPFFTSGNHISQTEQVKEWKVSNKFDPVNGHKPTSKLFIGIPPDLMVLQQQQQIDELNPFSVRIEYYIENSKEGIVFNTSQFLDMPIRSCYTNNNLLNNSTSYWVPCLDSIHEKYLWQLEIMTPRTLKDIYYLNQDDLSTAYKDHLLSYQSVIDTDLPNSNNHEIHVICGDSTTEKIQIINEYTKKTVFQLLNPTSPHHVGFAIGCFNKIVLPSISLETEVNGNTNEYNSSDLQNSSMQNVPLVVYYPLLKPSNKKDYNPEDDDDNDDNDDDNKDEDEINGDNKMEEDVINTVMALPKMLDFYIKNFGSFPFNSYTICFVPNLVVPNLDFQGLSLLDSDMVYSTKELDPMLSTTIELSKIFATQWAGINITPLGLDDIWCCLGIAGFMSLRFVQHLMGRNEFKYRLKMLSKEIVKQDYNKPPLANIATHLPQPVSLNEQALNDIVTFLKLKAPMILYILDRRMTKMERSFGMIRIIQKIMVQALSGELVNCSLSTANFQYMCERVYKNKLENFFTQWVHGSGVPIFRITQRFNKKRMMIEMGIKQVHIEEAGNPYLNMKGEHSDEKNSWNFIQDSLTDMDKRSRARFRDLRTPFFTGSMTIRVHEADGIPYEHVVRLTEEYSKLDVQYNTKYKRLRNRRKVNEKKMSEQNSQPQANDQGDDETFDRAAESDDDGAVDADILKMNCLGDVLTSKQDCRKWNLTDFSMTSSNLDENQLQNEAFEWLRVDTDFEWICKIHINQPDYMFASQLQQDKDVEAQLDSIRFFQESIQQSDVNSMVYSSILTRTILDQRYFYGVRLEAVKALGKFGIKIEDYQTFNGGIFHLLKIYKSLFCYEDNDSMPLDNDFVDLPHYLLQKTIISQFCDFKDETGEYIPVLKRFVLNLLQFNSNEETEFDDTEHVVNLINCLFKFIINNQRDKEWNLQAWTVIRRYEGLDKWSPTEKFKIYCTVIKWKAHLIMADYNELFFPLPEFLKELFENCWLDNLKSKFPKSSAPSLVKLSIYCLKFMTIFGIKNKEFLKFFFEHICFSMEPYVMHNGTVAFLSAINFIAINGFKDTYLNDDIESFQKLYNPHYKTDVAKFESLADFSDDEDDLGVNKDLNGSTKVGDDEFVFGGSSKSVESNVINSALSRKEVKLKETIGGLTQLLRQVFESYEPLKQILWFLINAPLFTDYQRKMFFEVIPVLYKQERRFYVSLLTPNDRELTAVKVEDNIVKIRKSDRSKYDPPPVVPVAPVVAAPPLKIKLKLSSASRGLKKPATNSSVKIDSGKVPKTPVKVQSITPVSVSKARKPPKVVRSLITKIGGMPLAHIKIDTVRKRVDASSVPFNPNLVLIKSGARSLKFKVLLDKSKLRQRD